MKRAYWFLLLFGFWCTVCAYWYMFSIKGIPADLEYFRPHPRMQAIAEILIMLLIACLFGFGIGWGQREDPILLLRQAVEDLELQNKELQEGRKEALLQLEKARLQLHHVQQTSRHEVDAANRKTEKASKELTELHREFIRVRENAADKAAFEALESEANTLRFRARQLEFQNKELEELTAKLRHEIDLTIALNARRSVEPVHPFVRPAEEDEKDDLTVIKGIGPFIEKRLNMVGIYTLRQISEFTPQTIEQVTKAIEFFPNRMVRDDWVGQAKRLVE